jgi:hypothetical protein
VVVLYWKVAWYNAVTAAACVDTRALLARGSTILYRLHDESRLTMTQEDWIIQLERALQSQSPPRGMRRLLAYGRAWLGRLTFR